MPRNASGTYTLPAGNPVEAGTVIEAAWANTTLEDLGNEITNSLSRTGEGGMLAPFRLADGTLAAPGIAWLNEPSTGFYRAGAGEMWAVVSGSQILQYTANGILIPATKTLTVQGNATIGGALAVTGATTLSSTLAVTGAITATGGVVGNVTGNVTGNVSGNAGTVTNGVYTNGSYADPAWITSLAGAKISGNISGNAATATYATSAGNAATVTNGVYTTGSYADPAWITSLAGSKITGALNNVTIGQTTAAAGSFTTLSASTSASLTVLTSTGLTKLGASTGTESLRVSSTSSAVNFVRVYGAATGSGPVIDAQGSDTNVDLSLSPKGSGNLNLYGGVLVQGGTANGVAYLNASKVLTTGSALQFDGSNLGLGVTPSASSLASFQSTYGIFVGSSQANITANAYYNAGWKYVQTGVQATRYSQLGSSAHVWEVSSSGTAGNAISFTQAMTLDASGNLGINTTSPATFGKLAIQVAGTTTPTNSANVGPSSINLYAAGNGGSTDCTTGIFGWNASQPGIGSGIGFSRENSGDWGTQIRFYTHPTSTSNISDITECVRITSGGDLLVNTTTTAGIITVDQRGSTGTGSVTSAYNHFHANTKYADFLWYGTTIGSITNVNGTAVAYNTTSDYRLKNNQQPLTGSGAFIDALKPKTWNWKADGSKGVGFIAHEVQEVSPGSVTGTKDAVDEEGKPIMQAMEYGSAEFIANIIAELQSLRARVAQLEAK